jgi:hypothetical protein
MHSLKANTLQHLQAARLRRLARAAGGKELSKPHRSFQEARPEMRKYFRSLKKRRRAVADSLRAKRREYGHELARIWNRRGGD